MSQVRSPPQVRARRSAGSPLRGQVSAVRLLRNHRRLVLAGLAALGVLGALLISRGALRPELTTLAPVTVPQAYAGTTYAFDGLVCLAAKSVPAEITQASDSTLGTVRTRVVGRPAGAPVAVAFPVPPEAADPLVGGRVAAGDERCLRVLVTPSALGEHVAGPVRLQVRYGPFGLLRSGLEVTPPVRLQVTGTGTDPRGRG